MTKIQVPAVKAIAIAAIPTAVLMGMGFIPRLAQADELPKNPFSGTSCEAAPDEVSDSESSRNDKSTDDSSTSTTSKYRTTTNSASRSPAAPAATSTNLLDLLGVDDARKDPRGGSDDSSTPTVSSSAPATAKLSATSDSVADKAEKTVEDTTDAAKKTIDKATKAAGYAKGSASPTSSAYLCPTYDADALADAKLEKTALLPDEPWVLKTSKLTLTGLDYKGIVEVKTYSGKVKKVLKFTAETVDIENLKQEVVGPANTTQHVDGREGSTSTIRGGTVTMYTESLKGNLFGLIPIIFTPKSPPPLNVPAAFFTNATVVQAGQFGGTLHVPGMHAYGTEN